MRFCSFASGSSGNCEYIGTETTNILVDMGISTKRIELSLDEIGVTPEAIDGIFITHEHSDHICGLKVFSKRYNKPIYATEGTLKCIEVIDKEHKINTSLFNVIKPNTDFIINDDITVRPFSISHDAYDPVCYTFVHDGMKIGMATDLGTYDDYIIRNLSGSDMLFIESNYEQAMLEVGKYPFTLKRRILSDIGHLANDKSARLVLELVSDRLKQVYLAHLSKENNLPKLAYMNVEHELKSNFGGELPCGLAVAARDVMSCETKMQQ